MSAIESYSHLTFNQDQSAAAEKLEQFINDPNTQVFILTGHAGTGKTSMISAIIRYLNERKQTAILLASTGRAAKVVGEKTGYHAETVHKHIYQLNTNISDEKNKIQKLTFRLRTNTSQLNTVYIIDESSMISDHPVESVFINFGTGRLLSDLFFYAGNRKIIFLGDPGQLPPVNTQFSPCLNKDYLMNNKEKATCLASLNQIMRFGHNTGIAYNSNALRQSIASGNLSYLEIQQSGFQDITIHYSIEEMVVDYIRSIKSQGIESSLFIAFTNGYTNGINSMVRSILFPKAFTIVKNELLMVVQNNYKFDLTNGEHILVNEVSPKKEQRAGLTFRDISFQFNDTEGYKVMNGKILEDLLYSSKPSLTQEQEFELWRDFQIRTHQKGIRNKDPEFIEVLITDPYLNALRARFGYAVTCHKAQGGEWNHVFLALEKSLFGLPREFQYRWTYTAISRAIKNLHLLDNMCIL
jgi:ATP-dependent exoDNAse (exonuclease V) alpha subunit